MTDYLPFDQAGKLVYAHSMDPRETWVALFEKAFAKAHGSYEILVSGHVTTGVTDLTSGCPITLSLGKKLSKPAADWLWTQLVSGKDSCVGVGLCKLISFGNNGLISGHAYAVIDVYNNHGIKLVKVRNPWGQQGEWKGKW